MKKNLPLELLQEETLGQKLVKKGFWLYLFSYVIAPAGYLIRLLISNSSEVSVADVGVLYSIISLIWFLNVYNDLGLTESLQYFLPKFRIQKQYNHIKTTILLSLFVQFSTALLIAVGLWFGSDRLALNYFHSESASTILKYFCLYFLGINLFQTLQSIFIAFQKTFDYQFVDFIKIRSIVWFTLFCFFTNRGTIERYSLNWILGLGVGILVAGILYYQKYRPSLMQGKFERDKPMLRKYKTYALRAFLGMNIGTVFGQIIQQLVIYFLGAEASGYYANFLSLFYIGSILIWPIMGLIFPMVSELIEKKETKKIWLLFSVFYSYFSIFALSISVVFLVFGTEIWAILFGERYLMSGVLLSRWSLFLIFNILSTFNFSVLGGMGAIKERVKILGSSALATILFTLIGIKIWGLYGAVIGFGMGYFFLWIGSFLFLIKRVQFCIQRKFILKNLIFFLVFWAILWSLKRKLELLEGDRLGDIGKLVGMGILFYGVWAGLNWRSIQTLKREILCIRKS